MNLIIGYDDNLGLPNDFANSVGCEIKPFHNLTEMLQAFARHKLNAMFIPAGTLPYVKEYRLLSQSLFGPQKATTLRSNFVTAEKLSVEKIPTIKLGRVNQYCTTSFWAPLIYLSKVLPKNTILKFIDTNGFQDMLIKTAARQVDAAMVWDIIMEENPVPAKQVHQLFYLDNLPSPIIIGKNDFPDNTLQKLNQFQSQDNNAFFRGFQAPNKILIQKFETKMQAAAEYFDIAVKSIEPLHS